MPPFPPMGTVVPPGAHTRSPARAPAGARRGVAVFGDSLVLQAWSYVRRIARDRGQPFDGGAYGGTALCDWLPGIRKVLHDDEPAYLVIAFAGNNLTPCTLDPSGRRLFGAPLVARYRHDMQTAISAAQHAHAIVFLVGPPSMRDHTSNGHAAGLRAAARRLAAHNRGVEYLDADARLSPGGFRPSLPCLAFETRSLGCHGGSIVVRADDGVHLGAPVHGYSAGAWRYATLLLRGVPDAT